MRFAMSLLVASAVGLAVAAIGRPAAANMSYTPWVHELNQVGQDVEVTVQVFEGSDALLGDEEIPMPDLDSRYTLTRSSTGSGETLLEDHVFAPGDAFEVTEFGCQKWESEIMDDPTYCDSHPEQCEDCDGDDVPECHGFCAVAYRFLVVDNCVPPGDAMYGVRTPECQSVWYEGEGLGFTNTVVEDTGDRCLDHDSGCSVSGVGAEAQLGALALFMLGIGLLAGRLGRSRSR